MDGPTVGLIAALVTLGTTVLGYLLRQLQEDVDEIHIMVNSRMDNAMKRIDQLSDTLRAAGVVPPEHPKKTTLADYEEIKKESEDYGGGEELE